MKKIVCSIIYIIISFVIFGTEDLNEFKQEVSDSFKDNLIYSFEIKDFSYDLDNDGKDELITIQSVDKKEVSINNNKINNISISNLYYFALIKWNRKIVLGLGYSDNGVNPEYRLYEYKNNGLCKLFEKEESNFEYIIGLKDNKILTYWNCLIASGNKNTEINNYLKFYDCLEEKWVDNNLKGKKLKNIYNDIFIYKTKKFAEIDKIEFEDLEKAAVKKKQYVGKLKEDFYILEIFENSVWIRTLSGKVGYLDRNRRVYD